MNTNFYGALSGNNYKIWKHRINGSDFNTQHIHPKIMVDISEKLSAEIYTCLSHDNLVSLITAYIDYELYSAGDFGATNYNVKVGRFDVPFGYFNSIAINPVDQKSVSRPLMWVDHEQKDMELNGGPSPIFMSPWTEIGAQFYGTQWVRGQKDQLWFGIYAINGLPQKGSKDIEWMAVPRMIKDNNGNKSIGGRVAYSFGDLCTAGVSYLSGKYDDDDELKYSIYGGDIHVALGKSNLRFEYAANPVDWVKDSSSGKTEYTKTGWYAQFDAPFEQVFKKSNFAKKFEFVTMYSFLEQDKDKGNQTFLDLSRFSVGVNFSPVSALKFRCEYQLTMPGDYNATASNVAKYGSEIKNLNRVQMDVGLAF
ncbi:MAG: hypothetical protein Q8O92_11880 [Candidatus Latescibacter sp.]|nr:hypothetical protein [Candidatus Latescibacter sp.]